MDNINMILEIVKDIRNTIHDFQAQQQEINKRVTHIEVTLEDIKSKISDHESRISNLDNKDKRLQGIVIFLCFMIPVIVSIIGIIY